MRNLCCFVLLLFCTARGCAQSNSYVFVWAGDDAKSSNDFLAVLDADSKSPHYGQGVAADKDGRRIVLNSGEYGEHRLFVVNFDPRRVL